MRLGAEFDFYSRLLILFLQVYSAALLGFIAYKTRNHLKFWQGLTRASLIGYLLGAAYGTVTVLLGLDPSAQVLIRLVALVGLGIGLTMTLIDHAQNPTDGLDRPSPSPG